MEHNDSHHVQFSIHDAMWWCKDCDWTKAAYDERQIDQNVAEWLNNKLSQQTEPEYITRITEEYRERSEHR